MLHGWFDKVTAIIYVLPADGVVRFLLLVSDPM